MALSTHSTDDTAAENCLVGEWVVLVGKLASMTQTEAAELVRKHGGNVSADDDSPVTLVVIGDDRSDLASALTSDSAAHQQLLNEVDSGRALVLHESELWQRLGLVGEPSDEPLGVRRLYTPAMLAEVLDVPVAAIRRWHRQGSLVACQSVRRLPYFDFAEVAVARHLATLYEAGCSLAVIDRKLKELCRAMPEVARPLCDSSVVVTGRQLTLRRGDELTEPGGQLLIDFDASPSTDEIDVSLSLTDAGADFDANEGDASLSMYDQLLFEALKWEDQGELQRAADVYRTLLMAQRSTAELHFALADLLYRMGDLPAARERFYVAIEIDEEYVEARANLGCVLAESGDYELAVAAFEGALAFHPEYADVHYHLADAHAQLGRTTEATFHWQRFLELAPESPWAETARRQLGQSEDAPTLVLRH